MDTNDDLISDSYSGKRFGERKHILTQILKVLEIKCIFFWKCNFFDSFDTFWDTLFQTALNIAVQKLENHDFCKELSKHAPTDDLEKGPNWKKSRLQV